MAMFVLKIQHKYSMQLVIYSKMIIIVNINFTNKGHKLNILYICFVEIFDI